jgi:hypothetical protein
MTGTILKKENSNSPGKLNVVLICVHTSILVVLLCCFFFFFKKKSLKVRVLLTLKRITIGHLNEMQLRREKISERMKNLQELVPNSNKVIIVWNSCFHFAYLEC